MGPAQTTSGEVTSKLDPQKIRRWRRTCFRLLKEVDPKWNPAHVSFSAATVLAASYAFSANEAVLQQVTGFSAAFIGRVMARLRQSKVWHGERMRPGAWDHPDAFRAQVGFICDALVATGGVIRMSDPKAATARAVRRQQRQQEGKCTACGHPWGGPQKTCATCRQRVRRSQQRHLEQPDPRPTVVQVVDLWYQAEGEEDPGKEK